MKPTTPINDLYQKVSKMKGLVVEESNHEIILDSKLRNPPLHPGHTILLQTIHFEFLGRACYQFTDSCPPSIHSVPVFYAWVGRVTSLQIPVLIVYIVSLSSIPGQGVLPVYRFLSSQYTQCPCLLYLGRKCYQFTDSCPYSIHSVPVFYTWVGRVTS